MELTHLNNQGHGKMVDLGDKEETKRIAIAQSIISMNDEAYDAIIHQRLKKGDALSIAQVAGIQAVKQTSHLIPMAHPLSITSVDIHFYPDDEKKLIKIECEVHVFGKTGVEMEALCGASICALTIYDMAKALDKSMRIDDTYLCEKIGGKSGHYERVKD